MLLKLWAGLRLLTWPPLLASYVSRQIYDRHCRATYGEPFPLILTVGVDPLTQGKGIGQLLLSEAEQFYQRSGLKKYYVDTQARNTGAVKFYTQSGFESREVVNGNVLLCRELKSGAV
jgi:GNAT superfamily N-acetyltransferase